VPSDNHRVWRALSLVAVFCGLRASELRGLRWADVDLGPAYQCPPARRRIPQDRQAQIENGISILAPFASAASIYGPSGLQVTPLIGKAAQMAGGSQHYACASLWIERGHDPKQIQTLIGHSSIKVTFNTYGHCR
jgi:integrase